VWEEPFGRVAAEAMINSIPALVSERGSLPDVVGGDFSQGGGGASCRFPEWMTFKTTKLPERGGNPAVVRGRLSRSGTTPRTIARSRRERGRSPTSDTAERVSRKKHVDYFTSLKPGGRPIADTPRPNR
jgi:hypothetical protein